VVQGQARLNLTAGAGVAVREFTLEKPHGRVDYLLFVHGQRHLSERMRVWDGSGHAGCDRIGGGRCAGGFGHRVVAG